MIGSKAEATSAYLRLLIREAKRAGLEKQHVAAAIEELWDRVTEESAGPAVVWSLLSLYESEDTTTGTQDLACSSGSCEIVGSAKQ